MTVRVMIIDGHAEFRALLMHHLTTIWDDAVISAYDPVSAGHLPDEFSGAGNDMVLLGSDQGDRDPVETARRFKRIKGFPPLAFFGDIDADAQQTLSRMGVDAMFPRHRLQHDELAAVLGEILRSRHRAGKARASAPEGGQSDAPSIKGYRLLHRFSVSDMSSVYLAEPESGGPRVVLKILSRVPDFDDGSDAFDRFMREYELIASLNHPGIITIHDLGVSDDHAHIVMEHLSGGNLREKIQRGVREEDARSYLLQIAAALAQIHAVGILHRDLKPGNIMFRADGSLAVIDFGLAKRLKLDAEITGTGEIFGTPYYMSPEQGHGAKVDVRSDIYSLGVIFFELLTGQKPYIGSSAMGIIYQHRNAPLPQLPEALSAYQVMIDRMLAKRVEDRLDDASEIPACLP